MKGNDVEIHVPEAYHISFPKHKSANIQYI